MRTQNCKPNNTIAKIHYNEWKNSGVSDRIIRANVSSVQGKTVDGLIFNGRSASDEFKDKFRGGGWWVTGLEPTDWSQRMRWGQLKLDNPRQQDGKIIKYESPIKSGTRATFLEDPSQPNFWQEVQDNPSIPLYITEGAKKAGCLMSLGYAAVAIPGVYCVAKKDKKTGHRELIPEMKPFAQAKRKIIYVYDADEKPKTKRYVYKALASSGKTFQDHGCDVSWVTWDGDLGKGIDDLYMNQGGEFITKTLNNLIHLKTYEETLYRVSTLTIDLHVFRHFFGDKYGEWACIDQILYRWDGRLGFWQEMPEDAVKKLIADYLSKCYEQKAGKEDAAKVYSYANAKNVNSSYKFATISLFQKPPEESLYLRTFKNGTLNCKTGEFRPWDRNDFLTWRLEADYTPNAALPDVTRDFFKTSFGEDLIPLLRAVTSMLLDPSAPWEHFPYVLGQSGGGKGTLIHLWQSMFHRDAVASSTNLSKLQTEEGRHQYLNGKALYTAPDVLGYVNGIDAFYELVSNGKMTGRTLFSSSTYAKHFNVRFAIASVEPLQVEGASGWDRRAIVIPVKNNAHKRRDPNLKQKLSACISDFISWALAMPKGERHDLLYNWRQSSPRLENAAYLMEIASDSMNAFVDACLTPDLNGPGMTATELQELYHTFAEATGKKGNMSVSRVSSKLKSIIPGFYEERRRYRKDEPNPFGKNMRPTMFMVKLNNPNLFSQRMGAGGHVTWALNKAALDEGSLMAFKTPPQEKPQQEPQPETQQNIKPQPETQQILDPQPEIPESPSNDIELESSQTELIQNETALTEQPEPPAATENMLAFKSGDRVQDKRDPSLSGRVMSIDTDFVTVNWDDGGGMAQCRASSLAPEKRATQVMMTQQT